MSALRSWLRAHRSAVVQEVLRRGLGTDAVAPPWFMFSTRSTSEAWLALEDFAFREDERRRRAKEDAERPIRAAAAADRTREVVAKLLQNVLTGERLGSIATIAAEFIRRAYPEAFTVEPAPAPAPADDANVCDSCRKPVEPGKCVRTFAGSVFHYGCFGGMSASRAPGCPTGGGW